MFVNKVASAAIHCESSKGPCQAYSWPRRFGEFHDRIASGKVVIHLPTRIQMHLKSLGKTGFDKQPFSYGRFGTGCSRDRG
jgi:hypothetical protein